MEYSIGFHKWAIQHGYDVNNADEVTEAYEKYIHLKLVLVGKFLLNLQKIIQLENVQKGMQMVKKNYVH